MNPRATPNRLTFDSVIFTQCNLPLSLRVVRCDGHKLSGRDGAVLGVVAGLLRLLAGPVTGRFRASTTPSTMGAGEHSGEIISIASSTVTRCQSPTSTLPEGRDHL